MRASSLPPRHQSECLNVEVIRSSLHGHAAVPCWCVHSLESRAGLLVFTSWVVCFEVDKLDPKIKICLRFFFSLQFIFFLIFFGIQSSTPVSKPLSGLCVVIWIPQLGTALIEAVNQPLKMLHFEIGTFFTMSTWWRIVQVPLGATSERVKTWLSQSECL